MVPPDSATRFGRLCLRATSGFVTCLVAGLAWAGPPFLSNDPDPPERGQWEMILPSTFSRASDGNASGEWTTLDFNYGYDDRTQLSAGLPVPFVRDAGQPRRSGLGDAFVEYKRRFGVEPHRGYFGIDPELAFPTGDPDRGLGAGKVTADLPLLYQRRWGAWTAYADTRYKWRRGEDGRSYWFYGAVLERRIQDRAEIGVELYGNSSRREGEGPTAGFDLGFRYSLSRNVRLIGAVGRSYGGDRATNVLAGLKVYF